MAEVEAEKRRKELEAAREEERRLMRVEEEAARELRRLEEQVFSMTLRLEKVKEERRMASGRRELQEKFFQDAFNKRYIHIYKRNYIFYST